MTAYRREPYSEAEAGKAWSVGPCVKVMSTYSTGRRLHAYGDGAFLKHVTDTKMMAGPCTLTVCS